MENMTDPDDRRSQARSLRQPIFPNIEQPTFGQQLAAQIPEVHIPVHIDAPRQFPMPILQPGLFAAAPAAGAHAGPVDLQEMLRNLPPMPVRPRRGRPTGVSGPRVELAGDNANPALNNVHRGHIAHREQVENNRQAMQELHRAQEELARQRQAVLMQQLEAERLRNLHEYEVEQERLRQVAQLLAEQQQRALAEQEMQAELQNQRNLDLEMQRQHEHYEHMQDALNLERQLHAGDDVQFPGHNAHAVQEIQDQWRREHERELDADFDDNPFDFLDDIGFQALDAMVAQALAQEQEQDVLDIPRRDEDMPKA